MNFGFWIEFKTPQLQIERFTTADRVTTESER
jgi:hypothetical protein